MKNEEGIIRTCLDALLAQSHIPEEVICVDNGSSDATLDVVRGYAEICTRHHCSLKILVCPVGNQIEARSMGFAAATQDVIGMIDADSILDEHWVEKVCERLSAGDGVVGVGGPIEYSDPRVAFFHSFVFTWFRFFPKHYYFYGCNGAFLRSAYLKTPGIQESRSLVERYHLHEPYDDLIVSLRLQKQGRVVLDPHVRIRSSMRTDVRKGTFSGIRNRSCTQLRESIFLMRLLKP